jgi:hypothetical protein
MHSSLCAAKSFRRLHIRIMKAKSARKPKKAAPPPLLLKRHRNDIIGAIQTSGLDPRQFDLKDSGTEARWKHKYSASCFIIGGRAGHYVGQYVEGDSPIAWPYEVYSWDALMERVKTWLHSVKCDLDTPDLWAELQRETKLLGVASNELIENRPFTTNEQKEIAERLDKLAKDMNDVLSLSKAQTQALNEGLKFLVDAAGRVGRKDWFILFMGVILPLIVSAALGPVHSTLVTFLRAVGLLYPELPLIE